MASHAGNKRVSAESSQPCETPRLRLGHPIPDANYPRDTLRQLRQTLGWRACTKQVQITTQGSRGHGSGRIWDRHAMGLAARHEATGLDAAGSPVGRPGAGFGTCAVARPGAGGRARSRPRPRCSGRQAGQGSSPSSRPPRSSPRAASTRTRSCPLGCTRWPRSARGSSHGPRQESR